MASRARHRLLHDTVSIGRFASEDLVVDNYSVSVGRKAGNNGPIGAYAIAIGDQAGENNQSTYSIAIGPQAGQFTQGTHAIAIGDKAGKTTQGTNAIAIGDQAGNSAQGTHAIAIGDQAGNSAQGTHAIAIGDQAGNSTQGIKSIAIGDQAGNSAQGARAIAIGDLAGKSNQPAYSIIITTSNTEIVAKHKGLYIDPVRKDDDRNVVPTTVKDGNTLIYKYATKEVKNGFPRLPAYPDDAEVLLAFTQIKKDEVPAVPPLGPLDNGTLYFDTTKKKVKVWVDNKWSILLDEVDYARIKAQLPLLPAL